MRTLNDYERAIYYVMYGELDSLLLLMERTKDDLLAKKIQTFLHSYYYSPYQDDVIKSHDNLLNYIDHAMGTMGSFTLKI